MRKSLRSGARGRTGPRARRPRAGLAAVTA
ncbi:hypothetical protein GA0115259_101291, partial [Streptomyces sp. MnatMP-M17]